MHASKYSIEARLVHMLRAAAFALMPSYLLSCAGKVPKESHPGTIAAFDGLRGYASVIVFVFHSLFAYSPVVFYGYGAGPGNYWFHQFPVVRLAYSGSAMVLVFYIISGYLLSLKPLRLIHAGSWDQAFHTLSSSFFRRGMRLFMPAIVSTFITMLLLYAGFFDYFGHKSAPSARLGLEQFELPAKRMDSFVEQWRDWRVATLAMMNPFTWDRYYNPYNHHLWTMSFELRGSFTLFLTILALARLTVPVRMLILSVLIWSFALYQRWEIALCLGGMFLAEVDLLRGTLDDAKRTVRGEKTGKNRWIWRVELLAFISALYLVSYPKAAGERAIGFRTISRLTPPGFSADKWWQSVGGMVLVWSVNNIPEVQPIFTNPFARYLGSISSAMHIVHGPVLHTIGLTAMASLRMHTGMSSPAQKSLNFAASAAIVLPVVFWVADTFWRCVDVPCARLSRWVETRLSSKTASERRRT